MSVSLIIISTAALMSAVGIERSSKATYDQIRAKYINEDANRRLKNAVERLDTQRKNCIQAFEKLGAEKLSVLDGSIHSFVDSFSQLKAVDFTDSVGLDELKSVQEGRRELEELQRMSDFSSTLLKGASIGAFSGMLSGIGACKLGSTYAAASAKTAVTALKGVIAKNATLAWLGGGSTTGGAAVLGGIIAGPALLAMGIIMGANAGKEMEKAKTNAFKVNEACEQYETGAQECIAIRRRCYMIYALLARLDAYLTPLCYTMKRIIQAEGTDYSAFCPESRKEIAAAAAAAVSVKAVLDTAILTSDGALTNESKELVSSLSGKLLERKM